MADFNIYEELMPKIQALIAPPDNTNSKEKCGSDLHPYFKRRGKRHNRDYCDACGERGNILCCDICPASFHLLCHDPPLSESDISSGHWSCHACKYLQKNEKSFSDIEFTDETNHEEYPEKELQSKSEYVLDNAVVIKSESMEEENIGSELDESCDETLSKAGIESNQELQLNKVPVKIEPETDDCLDSAEENDGQVVNLNMDDVWKIIGVNRSVEVSTEKLERKSSKGDVKISSDGESRSQTSKIDEITCNSSFSYSALKKRKISDNNGDSICEPEKKKRGRKPKCGKKFDVLKNEESNGIKRAFGCMIKEALKMNPKQFTLPIEYVTNMDLNLIGTEKDPDLFPNDLDSSDLLKLPARRCYYCQGTCLTGQMISCDFCPAHFHLNCLNPPLCNVPDVKWMCPLHPHHVLDRVMQNPSSITELMSWWSKFSAPIDDEDVKAKFLNKVKSTEKSPCQKYSRSSVKIPDVVKYHYKHLPPKIPTLQELVDSKPDCVFGNNFTMARHEMIEKSNNCCNRLKEKKVHDDVSTENQRITSLDSNSNFTKKYNLRPFRKKFVKLIEISEENLKDRNDSPKKTKQSMPETNCTDRFEFVSQGIYRNDNIPQSSESNNKSFETDLCWKYIENLIIRDINKNFITGGIGITSLSEDLKRLLMIQNVKNYTQDIPPSFLPDTNPYPFFHPLLKDDKKNTLLDRPKRNVRAVLCPLSHRPLVYIYGRSLSLGSGFSNDVCLLNYGNCNFISEEHAIIVFDKETNCYELINYSEYNTMVDGVCYTCDISRRNDKKSKTEPELKSKPDRRKTFYDSSSKQQKTGSTVMAAEARSIYKKLLQDIDKLVSKSQEEMATIAEEDLNEISRAIKTPNEIRMDSVTEKQKVKKKKFEKKKLNVNVSRDDDIGNPSKIKVTKRGRKPKLLNALKKNTDSKRSWKECNLSISLSRAVEKIDDQSYEEIQRPKKMQKGRFTNVKTDNPTNLNVVLDDEIDCSDDEYLLANNFYVNRKRISCRCQETNIRFPNGRDSSWEKSAPLYHGSYIRFGCLEFVFSIIDYPPSTEQRSYSISKEESLEPEESVSPFVVPEKDDLSMKLISILNVLTSKTSSKSSASGAISSSVSSVASSYSSRSNSPILENDSVTYENGNSNESDNIFLEENVVLKEGKIEITG